MEQHEHLEHHEHIVSEKKTTEDRIRQWATPILILVIGWLLSDKMGDIKEQLKVINTLQMTQGQMRVELDAIKKDVGKLESRMENHENIISDETYRQAEKNLRRK